MKGSRIALALISLVAGTRAFAHDAVECANSLECPGFVAWLRTSHSVCTSFLVKEDLIATNRHCVPEELLHEGADCTGKIEFIFPNTPAYALEKASCDRIERLSGELSKNLLTPDFAFVRLKEKVHRGTYPSLSRDGFTDNGDYTMYRINPEDNARGELVVSHCKATQETVINPYFNSNQSPVVTFARCPIRQGNSGSPILGADGSLHGILNAQSEVPAEDLSFAQKEAGKVDSAHGTNFACLEKDIIDSGTPDSACFVPMDLDSRRSLTRKMIEKKTTDAITSLTKKVNETSKKLLSMDRAFFAWVPKQDADESLKKKDHSYMLSVSFKPLCLVPAVANIDDYKTRLRTEPVTFHVSTPSYSFHQGIDESLHFRVEVRETEEKENVKLTPSDLLQRKNIAVEFSDAATERFLSKQSMELCTDLLVEKKPVPSN